MRCKTCGREPFVSEQGRRCMPQAAHYTVVREDGTKFARQCPNRHAAAVENAVRTLGIPPKYAEATLDSFELGDDKGTKKRGEAVKRVRSWLAGRLAKKQGLVIWGPPGVGKTHLAIAAYRELAKSLGRGGAILDWTQFLGDLRNAFDPTSETTAHEVNSRVDRPILLFDELGGGRNAPTPFQLEQLDLVIGRMYTTGRRLIVTTNYVPPGADGGRVSDGLYLEKNGRISGRMVSRLAEMCAQVDMRGIPDWRKRQ